MRFIKSFLIVAFILTFSNVGFGQNKILKRNVFIPSSNLIEKNHYLARSIFTFYRNEKNSINSAEVINLGLSFQNLELGVNFINLDETVISGTIRYLFYKRKDLYPDIVVGFEDLFSENESFTRTGFKLNENKNSFFFMAEKDYTILDSDFDFTLGIGTNGYESGGGLSQFTFGLFGGIKKQIGNWLYSFEFDGVKNYFSIKRQIGNSFQGLVSLRGLEDIVGDGTKDGNNTLGISIGLNFSSPIGLNLNPTSRNEIDKIKDEIAKETLYLEEVEEFQARQFKSQNDYLDSLFQVTLNLNKNLDSLKAVQLKLTEGVSLTVLDLALENLLEAENYFYQEKYNTAKRKCEKAIELVPNLSIAHGQLGSILYKLGLKTEAMKSFEKSIELDPNNIEIKEFLSRIKSSKSDR